MTNWVFGLREIVPVRETDLARIRAAALVWQKSRTVADAYDALMLTRHIENWRAFVAQDWDEGWDIAEYAHDLGNRYWIQLAVENTDPMTSERIKTVIDSADNQFRSRMKSLHTTEYNAAHGPFTGHPYFWEVNTIYGTLGGTMP